MKPQIMTFFGLYKSVRLLFLQNGEKKLEHFEILLENAPVMCA